MNSFVPTSPDPCPSVAPKLNALESAAHLRAVSAAQNFRRAEAELMEALIAVGEARVYLRLGYASLFQYATEELRLSEAVAYAAISVARKAAEVPILREAVGSGELSLSKARRIVSVLKLTESEATNSAWVAKAVHLPTRKLERAVAMENPVAAIAERAVYKSAKRIELTVGVGEELMLDLRQAQNLVSSSRAKAASLEGTLAEVVRFYLERKDPVRKARRITVKKGKSSSLAAPVDAPKGADSNRARPELCTGRAQPRVPIRAETQHFVKRRDEGRCQFQLNSGRKCGSRRWLDIHHIKPVTNGGTNAPENLITLCRAHHRVSHAYR